ncbi:pyridoxal-phosphate dependent enzyme [Erysipelotrichaceae bacterium OttesenSCG-928-M19]|nr:pyridoxal-phosphate dependent enzyme [Erysipelotrichaceae bacterium OttesenSCG-928-M19]
MNYIKKTNLIKSKKYSAYSQNNVYLKMENLQTTGSIKIRALINKIEQLKKETIKQIVVISTGNTGRSASFLAQEYSLKCTVYMPLNTSYSTILEIQENDAEVILVGLNIEETKQQVASLELEADTYIIDLADELDCSLAYESLLMEIVNEINNVDIILAPIGTGSLINGLIEGIKKHKLPIKVYAVEPDNHASLTKAIESNQPVLLTNSYSIAETVNGKTISKLFFKNINANIDEVIRVSDEELIDCFLDVVEENKVIVENSALVTLAGSKYLNVKHKNIVCLLTGGNVDITTMSTLLESGLINKGRIFTFSTMLSDKPGELLEVAKTVAENNGNVIGLNHNQLTALTRQNKVELVVTVETFGLNHKFKICTELENKGYEVKLLNDHLGSDFDG